VTSSRRKARRKPHGKASRAVRKAVGAQAADTPRRRVHLRLVQQPGSGEPCFELAAPVFEEDWQNRLTLATANTAFAMLRHDPSLSASVQLGKKSMDATSTLTSSLLSRAPDGALACRQGCAHCCHQRVGVTVPEALAIVATLAATRSSAEIQRVRERVDRAYHSTRGLSRDERNSPEHPCPLLENELCSVYEVRPLACRGVHSLDEQACKSKLHDRERRAAYERGELPGHSFVEPVRAVHAISAGLQLGLHEGLGLDLRPLDLTAALHVLLSEAAADAKAPSRPQRWLAGAPAFNDAYSVDAAHPGQVELSGAVALTPPRGDKA